MKRDEYVPIAVPNVNANTKKNMDSLPKNNTAINVINVDIDVFIDLANVEFNALLALVSNVDVLSWIKFSLSLSSTTIVSFTE